jgi:hypothetical protein
MAFSWLTWRVFWVDLSAVRQQSGAQWLRMLTPKPGFKSWLCYIAAVWPWGELLNLSVSQFGHLQRGGDLFPYLVLSVR